MSSDLRVPSAHLAGADGADLAWRVIEPVYNAVSIYDGPEVLAAHLQSLTAGQRALLALHWCVTETMNGGFDQFFTNPSGLLAEEARIGVERLAVPEAAELLTEAHAILDGRPAEADLENPDFDEAEGADRFDAYLARYALLEERFYVLVDGELYGRVAAYVRSHPEEFIR